MSQDDRSNPSQPGADAAAQPNGAAPAGAAQAQGGDAAQAADPGVSGPAAAGASPEPLAALQAELAAAQAKAGEHYDAYVRAVAETENIRRRAQEDVSKAHKFAVESFAESLLPVKDSLEMALGLPDQSLDKLREGVEATLRQLASAFEKNKLIEQNPVGQKFDPHKHQAISMVPAASTQPPVPANHVAQVLQKGYTINERVLRPALVVVAS